MNKPARPLTAADLCEIIRERHGLSLRALARRCGVTPPTVLDWTRDRKIPSDSNGLTLAALADLDPVAVLIGLQLLRADCPEARQAWRGVFLSQVWDGKRERRAGDCCVKKPA